MQFGTELVLISSLGTVAISMIVGIFLIRIWYRQENRLITDLPLVFAIAIMSNAINMMMIILPIVGEFTASIEYFRLRTMIIGGSVIPIFGTMFQIWLPSKKKYHNRILLVFLAYWASIAVFGPTESFIMMMCIPLILVSGVIIGATFIITWKTGRLTEVRSDLMVFSLPFSMGSQVLRLSFVSTPFFYVPDLLLMISFFFVGFGFYLPYRKMNAEKERKSREQLEQNVDLLVPA